MKKSRIIKKLLSMSAIMCLLLSCVCNVSVAAAGNMAFSVGCDYGTDDIDTSRDALKACDYYALAGYLSRYTCNPNVSKMTASYNGTKLLSSDIVFMAGHGSNNGMYFNSLQQQGNYNFSISDDSDSYNYINPANYVGGGKVKLMVFAGCETAKGTNNITKRTNGYGAVATIGWTVVVGDESMYQWSLKFNNCIALGYTIQNAINYANSFNYGDNTCKSYRLYGNGSQILKRTTSTAAVNTLAEDASVGRVSNAVINISSLTSKSKVEKIIRDCFSDFYFNDFEIEVAVNDDDKATLTVVEKIGDFVTQNAYVLFYENGKITKIYDRTVKEVSISEVSAYTTTATTINKQQAFSLAAEKVNDHYYTITEQTGKAMLDVETGEKYYMVYTTISTEQGAKSVISYKYHL